MTLNSIRQKLVYTFTITNIKWINHLLPLYFILQDINFNLSFHSFIIKNIFCGVLSPFFFTSNCSKLRSIGTFGCVVTQNQWEDYKSWDVSVSSLLAGEQHVCNIPHNWRVSVSCNSHRDETGEDSMVPPSKTWQHNFREKGSFYSF